jgi:hypothetical protein
MGGCLGLPGCLIMYGWLVYKGGLPRCLADEECIAAGWQRWMV